MPVSVIVPLGFGPDPNRSERTVDVPRNGTVNVLFKLTKR